MEPYKEMLGRKERAALRYADDAAAALAWVREGEHSDTTGREHVLELGTSVDGRRATVRTPHGAVLTIHAGTAWLLLRSVVANCSDVDPRAETAARARATIAEAIARTANAGK